MIGIKNAGTRALGKAAASVVDPFFRTSTSYLRLQNQLAVLVEGQLQFSGQPRGRGDERLLAAIQMLRPWDGGNLGLTRLGSLGDGGYVMANSFGVVGAISVGIGSDVSWDLDIAARGIPVAMFDPTVRRPPRAVPQGRFYRVGLAGSARDSGRYLDLDGIVRLAGWGSGDLILKCDIEGGEWDAFVGLSQDHLSRYAQVVMEIHNLGALASEASGSKILRCLSTLYEGHLPIHIHANNTGSMCRFDNFWFPDVLEVTYLRRDLLDSALPAVALREDLDFPSSPRAREVSLRSVLTVPPCDEFSPRLSGDGAGGGV
jgi:hypothetical protein